MLRYDPPNLHQVKSCFLSTANLIKCMHHINRLKLVKNMRFIDEIK